MNIKNEKGSITMFALIGLLFMTNFLLISIGSNINKSKIAKEQFDIMSNIYSYGDGDENAYNRAYTALRKKNAQILTTSVKNSSKIELTKTFAQEIYNLKIYGNTSKVGDLVTSTSDANYGKYKVQIKATNENATTQNTISIYMTSQLEKTDYIDLKAKKVIREETSGETNTIEELSITDSINMYEDYTKIEVVTTTTPSKLQVSYYGYTIN